MIRRRNLIITLLVSLCLLSNARAADDIASTGVRQLKVVIAHSDEGYAASIKDLLESKGIEVEALPVASLSRSVIEPCDLIILTGSGRRLGGADYVKEFNKPVLGYGVYGCSYFGKLKLKNGWPYT